MSGNHRYWAAARRQREERLLATATPVPERITAALDARGLYGPDVDRACGVDEPTVDRWETGELVPTAEQVQALARLTSYPVTFFYKPLPPIGPVWVCSRRRGAGCERVERPAPSGRTDQADARVAAFPGVQPTLF